jgi:micrococcal nuclease
MQRAGWKRRQATRQVQINGTNGVAKIYRFKPRKSRHRSLTVRPNKRHQLVSDLAHFKSSFLLLGIAIIVIATIDSVEHSGIEPMWKSLRDLEKIEMQFDRCGSGISDNCVVDGDTFKLKGRKVRVLGIDAPETHPPRCSSEAELGEQATSRFQEILNEGPFEIVSSIRGRDVYGRDLRWLLRDGKAITATMIDEGLARRYRGGLRSDWCD